MIAFGASLPLIDARASRPSSIGPFASLTPRRGHSRTATNPPASAALAADHGAHATNPKGWNRVPTCVIPIEQLHRFGAREGPGRDSK